MSGSFQINRSNTFTEPYYLNWENVSHENLYYLFSWLNPEQLQICRGVCSQWNQVAQDNSFYFDFARRLKFFFFKNGENYFLANSRERFLSQYKITTPVEKREYEGCFEAIQRCQSMGCLEQLETCWKNLLPPEEDFTDFTSVKGNISKLDYAETKNRLVSLMNQGGLQFEKGGVNRPFFLSCYWGDIELMDRLGEVIKDSSSKDSILIRATLMAVMGRSSQAITKLREIGADFYAVIFPGITLIDYIKSSYPDMAHLMDQRNGMN